MYMYISQCGWYIYAYATYIHPAGNRSTVHTYVHMTVLPGIGIMDELNK